MAATAAWLVIHGVAAGMRRESQRRLWNIRWREVGAAGGAMAAQWRNVSRDWLINYPMQAVHPIYRLPVL